MEARCDAACVAVGETLATAQQLHFLHAGGTKPHNNAVGENGIRRVLVWKSDLNEEACTDGHMNGRGCRARVTVGIGIPLQNLRFVTVGRARGTQHDERQQEVLFHSRPRIGILNRGASRVTSGLACGPAAARAANSTEPAYWMTIFGLTGFPENATLLLPVLHNHHAWMQR